MPTVAAAAAAAIFHSSSRPVPPSAQAHSAPEDLLQPCQARVALTATQQQTSTLGALPGLCSLQGKHRLCSGAISPTPAAAGLASTSTHSRQCSGRASRSPAPGCTLAKQRTPAQIPGQTMHPSHGAPGASQGPASLSSSAARGPAAAAAAAQRARAAALSAGLHRPSTWIPHPTQPSKQPGNTKSPLLARSLQTSSVQLGAWLCIHLVSCIWLVDLMLVHLSANAACGCAGDRRQQSWQQQAGAHAALLPAALPGSWTMGQHLSEGCLQITPWIPGTHTHSLPPSALYLDPYTPRRECCCQAWLFLCHHKHTICSATTTHS